MFNLFIRLKIFLTTKILVGHLFLTSRQLGWRFHVRITQCHHFIDHYRFRYPQKLLIRQWDSGWYTSETHWDAKPSVAAAAAYYGVIKPFLEQHQLKPEALEKLGAQIGLAIEEILLQHSKVLFWEDMDAQNKVIDAIEDYLYDEIKGAQGVMLTLAQIDELIERAMQVARARRPS